MRQLKPVITLILPLVSILLPICFVQAALPEGSLIKADDDAKVYYLENGERRWIESGEIFLAQGFNWLNIQTVPRSELNDYPEGQVVRAGDRLVLPGEAPLLPDLAPLAPHDLRLADKGGRQVLWFGASFWNQGRSDFELVANPALVPLTDDVSIVTHQRIANTNGSYRDKIVGYFLWHAIHDHFHYKDFANYTLEYLRPLPGNPVNDQVPETVIQKSTFCMRDNSAINLTIPNATTSPSYTNCNKYHQGVSVGWADVYPATLSDQYVDVSDLPPGIYKLSFTLDPEQRFVEGDYNNNEASTLIELNVPARTMKVIASAMPFDNYRNSYPDGLLVQAVGDPRVYVLKNGQRRWIINESVFVANGYSWDSIYTLPGSVINAIPLETLIRQTGTDRIYTINEAGYRRRILNPTVLSSYGWLANDVTEVSAVEFQSYADTELIKLPDLNSVYSISEKKYVGEFADLANLGFDPASVHIVNQVDLSAYGVQVIAQGLEVPWDIVFLPGDDMLVTERTGTIKRLGSHPADINFPETVAIGEGGLMGLALHPQFSSNNLVYVYYTTLSDSGKVNRITRFRLDGDNLIKDKDILTNIPAALYHDGGQIAFGPDGMLYVTTGDAEIPNLAQDLNSLAGKTLRLTPEGSVPSDNPFPNSPVWSYGHRNAQGIAWDDQGRMWETEHGRSGAASGYDELNLIEKGKNYGWPVIQSTETRADMVTPVLSSSATDTWAPSGLAFLNGRLYFAGLRGATLYEVTVDSAGLGELQRNLVGAYGRLRAAVVGPDGFLYITTSNRDGRGTVRPGDDQILRVHTDFLP